MGKLEATFAAFFAFCVLAASCQPVDEEERGGWSSLDCFRLIWCHYFNALCVKWFATGSSLYFIVSGIVHSESFCHPFSLPQPQKCTIHFCFIGLVHPGRCGFRGEGGKGDPRLNLRRLRLPFQHSAEELRGLLQKIGEVRRQLSKSAVRLQS